MCVSDRCEIRGSRASSPSAHKLRRTNPAAHNLTTDRCARPQGFSGSSMGEESAMKPGIDVGGGAPRECAAYLLDHEVRRRRRRRRRQRRHTRALAAMRHARSATIKRMFPTVLRLWDDGLSPPPPAPSLPLPPFLYTSAGARWGAVHGDGAADALDAAAAGRSGGAAQGGVAAALRAARLHVGGRGRVAF
jgi:hypothetical protein